MHLLCVLQGRLPGSRVEAFEHSALVLRAAIGTAMPVVDAAGLVAKAAVSSNYGREAPLVRFPISFVLKPIWEVTDETDRTVRRSEV
jgi:hypothetical protein